ncbi:LysR family transcriptional regulator [Actinoallomurus acanthiterrae]
MEHLELRHLRMLCAIADTGGLGRAATLLGYSQPAVSAQLGRIEGFLGEPLFTRSKTGMAPTAFGMEVVARARDVLARAKAIERRSAGTVFAAGQVLRLAATNTPILPGTVARIRTALPDLTLTISSVYASSQIVELLEDDKLDAAIGVDYPGLGLRHSDAVAQRAITTEPAFVALPAGHRLADRPEVSLTELADDAWFLTPDDGAGWPGVFYTACQAAGFSPVTVHEFLGDRLQLQSMIAGGEGVSIVQATFPPADGVLIKPLTGTPVWHRYLLAWRAKGVRDKVVETVHQAATAAYRDLITDSPHFRAWATQTSRLCAS